jgi:dihydrodipicolinate synthase/N-acetylneuraminate lyase
LLATSKEGFHGTSTLKRFLEAMRLVPDPHPPAPVTPVEKEEEEEVLLALALRAQLDVEIEEDRAVREH